MILMPGFKHAQLYSINQQSYFTSALSIRRMDPLESSNQFISPLVVLRRYSQSELARGSTTQPRTLPPFQAR